MRDAIPQDIDWVRPILDSAKHILGNGTLAWYRFWHGGLVDGARWIVVEGKGFVHFKRRRDGTSVIYEIAVSPDHKRQGVGRQLVAQVGYPIELKTDADNEESNAFYRALGFHPIGCKVSKKGKRMRIYRCAP